MQKIILLSALLIFTNFNSSSLQGDAMRKDLQSNNLETIISQIKNRGVQKNATLISEQRFNTAPNDGERILWQGGFSYCDGQCASVITVTANFIFGIQFNTQVHEDFVPEDCECGGLLDE